MALHETYSQSGQIGEEGQQLVGLTVARLGHLWHDRRVDLGIDGEIELVDPVAWSASNVHVAREG